MTNPISKLNKIETLRPQDLNCNIFSVYDYDACTIQELLCQFFEKINQCVDVSNATFKLAEWLVNEGLEQEVVKKLELWLADGTLATIINETIFKELNAKVDLNTSKIIALEKKVDSILEFNAVHEGLDNTGVTDNTDKLNLLIQKVANVGGGTIRFPKGDYKVDGQIIMKPFVRLLGNMPWRGKSTEGYSVFKCSSLDKPQFLIREYTSIDSFCFDYPGQGNTVATIKQYDFTIATDTTHLCDDIQLSNIYLPNSYKGISLDRAGRFNLSNIYGQPINKGLYVDRVADVANIDRVEFWPFTYFVGSEVYNEILKSGNAFEFKKADGVIANNMFCYGYDIGFHINGDCWATFTGCTVDITKNPILVWDANIVEFIGGAFVGSRYDSTICKITKVRDSFKLMGCNFFGNNNIGVLNKSTTGKVVCDVNFKSKDNKIKIPIIHDGDSMIYRTNNPKEKVYGSVINTNTDSITGGGQVVKNIQYEDIQGDPNITKINNGFRVAMNQVVSGEKTMSGAFDLSSVGEFTKGVYYLEMTINQVGTTDRKRLGIDLRNDTPKIINNIINEYPFVLEPTTIRYPIYVADKNESKKINFYFNYYDEPKASNDYIELTNINLVKMGTKVLSSTIENAYRFYEGDTPIDYNIMRG